VVDALEQALELRGRQLSQHLDAKAA
jgi:hypothetical protein